MGRELYATKGSNWPTTTPQDGRLPGSCLRIKIIMRANGPNKISPVTQCTCFLVVPTITPQKDRHHVDTLCQRCRRSQAASISPTPSTSQPQKTSLTPRGYASSTPLSTPNCTNTKTVSVGRRHSQWSASVHSQDATLVRDAVTWQRVWFELEIINGAALAQWDIRAGRMIGHAPGITNIDKKRPLWRLN